MSYNKSINVYQLLYLFNSTLLMMKVDDNDDINDDLDDIYYIYFYINKFFVRAKLF